MGGEEFGQTPISIPVSTPFTTFAFSRSRRRAGPRMTPRSSASIFRTTFRPPSRTARIPHPSGTDRGSRGATETGKWRLRWRDPPGTASPVGKSPGPSAERQMSVSARPSRRLSGSFLRVSSWHGEMTRRFAPCPSRGSLKKNPRSCYCGCRQTNVSDVASA